ncbi:MAG: amidohydrolase family protein, partial [Deltaproteobacteria bacterium]|nr:amidohydrolase family protein [Candidatus Tharpella sp.]
AVGHHHVYSALARGMGAPKKNPENFYEILKYVWWTLDKALDKDSVEASALATAIACAKAGSTFVIDHHASPNFIEGSLETIARAFDKVGVSHLLCYEITDRDGMEKAEQGLDETENYLKIHQGLVGLHASFTVGDQSMKKAADLMEKFHSGFHIHVAEDNYDQEHSVSHYGKRVIQRLNDYGVLDSTKTILGHCLHLSDEERKIIYHSKATVVENAESNLNNAVGFFNGTGLGNRIMLGTDGMHSDMIRSAQQAFFTGQTYDNIDYPGVYQRFREVHHYLENNHFEGDGDNNLVVLDYQSPTPIHQDNFLGHFVFGFRSADVQHVISNGKLIVKDREMQTINEKETYAFAQEQAVKLWERMQK